MFIHRLAITLKSLTGALVLVYAASEKSVLKVELVKAYKMGMV